MAGNAKILEVLKELSFIYDVLGDTYRARAYKNGYDAVAHTISLGASPMDMKGEKYIGKSIYETIKEVYETGDSKKLVELREQYNKWKEFAEVPNFGTSLIRKIILSGVKSLKDLEGTEKIKLTKAQRLSLKHRKDLLTLIPRKDTESLGNSIIKIVKALSHYDGMLVGSYRRGKELNGDVDIVIWGTPWKDVLKELRDSLKNNKRYIGTIALGKNRYTFYIEYNGVVRQVDIFNAGDSHITHILYGTGSAEFNQEMRANLKKRGYKLSRNALIKISTGEKINVKDEKEIFKLAEMKYIPPEDR